MKGNTPMGVKVSCTESFGAFDLLPKTLRRRLSDAPFNFDAIGALDYYRQSRDPGAFIKKLNALIETKLNHPFLGTAAIYGPDHPQARQVSP